MLVMLDSSLSREDFISHKNPAQQRQTTTTLANWTNDAMMSITRRWPWFGSHHEDLFSVGNEPFKVLGEGIWTLYFSGYTVELWQYYSSELDVSPRLSKFESFSTSYTHCQSPKATTLHKSSVMRPQNGSYPINSIDFQYLLSFSLVLRLK